MTWEQFQEKIQEDMNCGKRHGRVILMEFRRHYKGNKEAIQKLVSVKYDDEGRLVFKYIINDKQKQMTI